MEYNTEDLSIMSDDNIDKLIGKTFLFSFLNTKTIEPHNNKISEGEFIIHGTTSGASYSTQRCLISGFVIREASSNVNYSVDFDYIKKMILID